MDFREQCPSLLHQTRCEATLDVRQDEFASQNSLKKTCVASHEESIQGGSLCRESVTSSMRWLNTHIPSFSPEQVSSPASWLHGSPPAVAQLSSVLFYTLDSCGESLEDGHISPTQIFNKGNFQAHETHAQVNQADAHLVHETHGHIEQTPWIDTILHFNSSKVGPSVLTSFKQVGFLAKRMKGKDADVYQSESGVQSLQERVRLTSSPSASLRLESSKRTKHELLQEIHEPENGAIKEVITSSKPPSVKALKENLAPQFFKQECVEGRDLKAEATGWICPRDAKKDFKPKPRQGLLDKWLRTQR